MALQQTRGGAASVFGTEMGVYVGCMFQEYGEVLVRSGGVLSSATATGNSLAFMVGRCDAAGPSGTTTCAVICDMCASRCWILRADSYVPNPTRVSTPYGGDPQVEGMLRRTQIQLTSYSLHFSCLNPVVVTVIRWLRQPFCALSSS